MSHVLNVCIKFYIHFFYVEYFNYSFSPLLYSVNDGERIKFEVTQEVLVRWSYNYGNCGNKNQNMVNVLCIVFHKSSTRKGICDIFTLLGLYLGELLQWNLSLTFAIKINIRHYLIMYSTTSYVLLDTFNRVYR